LVWTSRRLENRLSTNISSPGRQGSRRKV
jgi:hypothetical protein